VKSGGWREVPGQRVLSENPESVLQERIHVVAVSSQRIDDRCLNFSDPDPARISTSYVERQNLLMRVGIRRFTRLTNAFSKKLANHVHALSIYFMHYNFVRIHQTLRVTPAMEAGVTDRLWSLEDNRADRG
jgi:hypothetical protein